MPGLSFEDNSIDVICGMGVFTPIKYHWDFWLFELKRVLKPGGLLLQTIHAERAWKFYHNHKNEDWVKLGHSSEMLSEPEMNVDYLLYGDINVSQVFFKEEVARRYWGRYLNILDFVKPDSDAWFQDLIVGQKSK